MRSRGQDVLDHPDLEERVTRGQMQTTWAELVRALDSDENRITVETTKRSALRNVANALGLGTMHESHFMVSKEWLQLLDRHLHAARDEARSLTVGDVRALIDTAAGGPRGLPPEIADLVVLLVAAQTDHALTRSGRPLPADPGKALPADAVLRPEHLPDATVWAVAVRRAQAVFGVNASPRPSAAEMASLADRVRIAATALRRTSSGSQPSTS